MDSSNYISFNQVVDLEQWQHIQDNLAGVLGIPIRTVDTRGRLLTIPSNQSRLCTEFAAKTKAVYPFCLECFPSRDLNRIFASKEEIALDCIFGLNNFAIPIIIAGGKSIGYILVGPCFVNARKKAEELTDDIADLDLDQDELNKFLPTIKLFSSSRISSVIKLLRNIFHSLAQLGFQKMRLGEISPQLQSSGAVINAIYEEQLLDRLLDVAHRAVEADSGSIMLHDWPSGTLVVKVSVGNMNNDARNFQVKLGESVAGVAAMEEKMMVISPNREYIELSGRLNRPDIISSLVMPFSLRQKEPVYAVLNLNSYRTNRIFEDNDAELIQELIDLSRIALAKLKQS